MLDRPCQYHWHTWVGDYICEPVGCAYGDDPRWTSSNLLFDTIEEDLDGDGELDPGEDTDFDGVLDHPNTWSGEDRGSAAADDLLTFWEKETNSLITWPVLPLQEGTTYAVVITKSVTGEDGSPVESPFEGVHSPKQRKALTVWLAALKVLQQIWTF